MKGNKKPFPFMACEFRGLTARPVGFAPALVDKANNTSLTPFSFSQNRQKKLEHPVKGHLNHVVQLDIT
ncbi:hypothetical protein [Desulfocicer niacini]